MNVKKIFVHQTNGCYIYFAINVEHQENLTRYLFKMNNAITILNIEINGFNLIKTIYNMKRQDSITVYKIPKKKKKKMQSFLDYYDLVQNTFKPRNHH